jgi:hypothetical protein
MPALLSNKYLIDLNQNDVDHYKITTNRWNSGFNQ